MMTCLKTGQVCELKTSTCPVSSGCFLVCSSQVFLNVLVIDRNLGTDELYWKGFTVGRSDVVGYGMSSAQPWRHMDPWRWPSNRRISSRLNCHTLNSWNLQTDFMIASEAEVKEHQSSGWISPFERIKPGATPDFQASSLGVESIHH